MDVGTLLLSAKANLQRFVLLKKGRSGLVAMNTKGRAAAIKGGRGASRAVAVCLLALAHQPCLAVVASTSHSSAKTRTAQTLAAFVVTPFKAGRHILRAPAGHSSPLQVAEGSVGGQRPWRHLRLGFRLLCGDAERKGALLISFPHFPLGS